jgi:hypothetical protein
MALSNFLERKEYLDFSDDNQKLLNAYKEMGCPMSLKVHLLHSHLDFFQTTLMKSAKSKVKAFIKSIEHRYLGFWYDFVIAAYCWMLYRDAPDTVHHQKRKLSRVYPLLSVRLMM